MNKVFLILRSAVQIKLQITVILPNKLWSAGLKPQFHNSAATSTIIYPQIGNYWKFSTEIVLLFTHK